MSIEKTSSQNLLCQEIEGLLLEAAEKAAINASRLCGRGQKNEADGLAVSAMRDVLKTSNTCLEVVIGEGEMDEAPMLYIGERFGTGDVQFEIAVDPLEGTNLCAKDMPNSITAIAASYKGGFLKAPDCYMHKLSSGRVKEEGVLHFEFGLKKNLYNLADYLKKDISEVKVIMLDRERHLPYMKEIRELGARVSLISDGDIHGVIRTTDFGGDADLYCGMGGAPEGVLSCSILNAIGGFMMGRLEFENEEQRQRAISYGLENPTQILSQNDIVKKDAIFVASGVTSGDMLKGVEICQKTKMTRVESVVFSSISGKRSIKKILHLI